MWSQKSAVAIATDKAWYMQRDIGCYLEVAEKVSEVDVEELSTLSDHDVIRVTVADPQHVRGHAVACTGDTEGLFRLTEPATKRHR